MKITKFDDVKHITLEEYFKKNKFSVDMFRIKYTYKNETPAETFWRVSSIMENKENKENMFSLLWNDWFRPGGSILKGVGIKRKNSLINCTTLPLKDDTLEAINNTEYYLMKCAAYRQGMGIDLSKLRPRGAKVSNAAEESTGVVPWGTKFSKVSEYVGQKGRLPALLLSLKANHPDIEEFIESKIKDGKIENANISVQINEEFIKAVKNDEIWHLEFETKHEIIKKQIKARYLMDLISKTAWKSAEPGIQLIDKMRQGSMIHAIYQATGDERFKIISTNACSEKPLSAFGCCNLGSINMENFSADPEIYKKQLEELIPLITRFQDNIVSYELENNLSPIKEQKDILTQTREIGLGITNYHGWLLKNDVQYDSDEAIEKMNDFMKHYSHQVFKTSMELGKEKGNAPAFDLPNVKPDDLMNSLYFKNIVNEFYDGDFSRICYMRNLAHMSIAPTGSISNTFSIPCISSGIEPIISHYYWRKTRAMSKGVYEYYFVIPERVKQYILPLIKDETDKKIFESFNGSELDKNGKIGEQLVNIMNKYLPKGFFKPAYEIDYMKKMKLLDKVYQWIDSAISCTFNLPNDATIDDVKKIYEGSFNRDIRGISIYREGSRDGILIYDKKLLNVNSFIRPEEINQSLSPKRPNSLNCKIHYSNIKGEKWIIFVGLLKNKPYEVFCGKSKNIQLEDDKIDNGWIIKSNNKYDLKIGDKIYKNLATTLMTTEQKALTRLISLSLRHGTPIEFIISQLKKCEGNITGFTSVINRTLKKYIKNISFLEEKSNLCDLCNSEMAFIDGCWNCLNCGNGKCE